MGGGGGDRGGGGRGDLSARMNFFPLLVVQHFSAGEVWGDFLGGGWSSLLHQFLLFDC